MILTTFSTQNNLKQPKVNQKTTLGYYLVLVWFLLDKVIIKLFDNYISIIHIIDIYRIAQYNKPYINTKQSKLTKKLFIQKFLFLMSKYCVTKNMTKTIIAAYVNSDLQVHTATSKERSAA